MGLGMKEVRACEEEIKRSLEMRGMETERWEEAMEADRVLREVQTQTQALRAQMREMQVEIAAAYKSGSPERAQAVKEAREEMKGEVAVLEEEEERADDARRRCLARLPNMLSPSVSEDLVVLDSITPSTPESIPPTLGEGGERHDLYCAEELLVKMGGADFVRGSKVGGSRGFYLFGPGMILNRALAEYGLDVLGLDGFTRVSPPLLMKQDLMEKASELGPGLGGLYELPECHRALIPSAEQPLAALHANEILEQAVLPLRYAGFSQCFRPEAGERSARGLFRVHTFDKVEQFIVCVDGEDATCELDAAVGRTSAFYASLGLSHRVVRVPVSDLAFAAHVKHDVEALFVSDGTFRELASASSTRTFQSRALNVRVRSEDGASKPEFVHMVNATLVATHRTLCAVLEAWQTPDGVVVPPVLRPYLPPSLRDTEVFPFMG